MVPRDSRGAIALSGFGKGERYHYDSLVSSVVDFVATIGVGTEGRRCGPCSSGGGAVRQRGGGIAVGR